MKKKSIFVFVVAALILMFAPSAFAYTIYVDSFQPYRAGHGGEFTLTPGGGLEWAVQNYAADTKNVKGTQGTFQSFCMELNETIPYRTTYAVTLDNVAIGGNHDYGNNDPGNDPLSLGAAWLYKQFANGSLAGYDYSGTDDARKASAKALQDALWYLEDEILAADFDVASNTYVNMLISEFSSIANAKMDNNETFNVKVANLWLTGEDGQLIAKQSQLVLTPIPGVIWLLGSGLVGLVGIRRKMLA